VNKDHLNQTDEMIEKFIGECEKEAAATLLSSLFDK
jgi:hypothetical protein